MIELFLRQQLINVRKLGTGAIIPNEQLLVSTFTFQAGFVIISVDQLIGKVFT